MAEDAIVAAVATSEVGEPDSCLSYEIPTAYLHSELYYSDAALNSSEASWGTFGTGDAAVAVEVAVA